ncbi:MAG TPA: FMN-binding glutamate synthase family protein [Balneolales bacterium]|nr:FMN-binding glutamate synthase family protein [Balneolales bacterium]
MNIPSRNQIIIYGLIVTLIIVVIAFFWSPILWLFVLLGPAILLGLFDMIQRKHTILRNFPLLGHFRFWLESLGPELHQYFVENNTDGAPFNKNQRSFVYKRSKKRLETHPFGTELNVYDDAYEWAPHSIYAKDVMEEPPRVTIGGSGCKKPYDAALFNISAMSYGALSANAVRALNKGAKIGGFFHDTGEGGISPYHLEGGGDLVWEIGSGYFGCRTKDGHFSEEQFQKQAVNPVVKMIEIKLSQGAKPGHGGVLPAVKNTPEIANIRGVEPYTKVVSPAYHKAFSDAKGLLQFVQKLRELSENKPVGFKLCIGSKKEFIDICESMIETGIKPDFITIDGSEGGTGAAPIEFSDSMGMPLEEGLTFAVDTLKGYDLKKDIRVIASGKIITAFDIIKNLCLGADLCNSARGMMFALGCIQALKCDSNECPTGVTTHKSSLTQGLVVSDKSVRVANYQGETVNAALELLAGMGIDDLSNLNRSLIYKRTAPDKMASFDILYPPIKTGRYISEK